MSGKVNVEILNSKSLKQIASLELDADSTILDVKKAINLQSNLIFYFLFLLKINFVQKK